MISKLSSNKPKSLWLNQQSVSIAKFVLSFRHAILLFRNSSIVGFSSCKSRVQAKWYSIFRGVWSTSETNIAPYSFSKLTANTSPILKWGSLFVLDLRTLNGFGFSLCSCTANLSNTFWRCLRALLSISSQNSWGPWAIMSKAFSLTTSGRWPIFHNE